MKAAARKTGITNERITLIHVAKARVGINDETYRNLLARVAGVRSSKELDDAGFAAVMEEFKRFGFTSSRQPCAYGDRFNMATPKQIDAIRSMWRRYSGEDDDRDLRRFMQKRFRISDLRFVDRFAAVKLMTALTKMVQWRGAHPVAAAKRRRVVRAPAVQQTLPLASDAPPF